MTKKLPSPKAKVRFVVDTSVRIALGDSWLAIVTHVNGCVTELRIIQEFQAAPAVFPYAAIQRTITPEFLTNAIALASEYEPVL